MNAWSGYVENTSRRLREGEESNHTLTQPGGSGSIEVMSSMAGTALSGGSIYNGLAGGNVDAVETEGATLDGCLSHGTPTGELHYHSLSPCIKTTSQYYSTTTKPALCSSTDNTCVAQVHAWSRDGWTDTSNYGGVFGIARDGHVLYGPYNANGEVWGCDDHDVCNGFFLADGSYGYAATSTFPYVVGCWGPGPAQSYAVTCSSFGCSSSSYSYAGMPANSALVGISTAAVSFLAIAIANLF